MVASGYVQFLNNTVAHHDGDKRDLRTLAGVDVFALLVRDGRNLDTCHRASRKTIGCDPDDRYGIVIPALFFFCRAHKALNFSGIWIQEGARMHFLL